jgi:hypothetical protein
MDEYVCKLIKTLSFMFASSFDSTLHLQSCIKFAIWSPNVYIKVTFTVLLRKSVKLFEQCTGAKNCGSLLNNCAAKILIMYSRFSPRNRGFYHLVGIEI